MFAVNAYFAESQVVEINGETNSYNGLEIDGVGATGGSVVDNHFCVTRGSTVYWDLTLRGGNEKSVSQLATSSIQPFPYP